MRITMTLVMIGLLGSWGCSNRGTQVTSAASITDSDLRHMVQAKLESDPQLAQIDVDANAEQNQVTLSGSVSSEQARNEAVDLAKSARANMLVNDKIDVKPAEISRTDYTEDMARETREQAKSLGNKIGQSLDDAWLYSKIETKFAADSLAPAFKINVDVDKDVVTLRGTVETEAAKQRAEEIAQQTEGVHRVVNLLKVKV